MLHIILYNMHMNYICSSTLYLFTLTLLRFFFRKKLDDTNILCQNFASSLKFRFVLYCYIEFVAGLAIFGVFMQNWTCNLKKLDNIYFFNGQQRPQKFLDNKILPLYTGGSNIKF